MCIINHTYKFVFIHIPKCAGTSASAYFSKYSRYRDLELGGTRLGEIIQDEYYKRFGLCKHSPANEIRRIMGECSFGDYFSFAFVRHPETRLISTYYFLKYDFRDWPGSSVMDKFPTLASFISSSYWMEEQGVDHIFREQLYWLCDGDEQKTPIVNKIVKVEYFGQSLSAILEEANLPSLAAIDGEAFEAIPRLNVTNYGVGPLRRGITRFMRAVTGAKIYPAIGKKNSIRISDKERQYIVDRYACDYERLGYRESEYDAQNECST